MSYIRVNPIFGDLFVNYDTIFIIQIVSLFVVTINSVGWRSYIKNVYGRH